MASMTQPQGIHRPDRPHPNLAALVLVCCLPVVAIGAILFSAGGTRVGFLAPALVCGVMIGILMFVRAWEGPAR